MKDRLPPQLTTARLVLATPTLTHVPEMAVLANNKAIHAVLSRLPHPYAESDGRFFVEEIARGLEEFAWAIELRGRFIGSIGLNILPDQSPALGYWLGEPHWGKGYATEAGEAIVAAARAAGYPTLRSQALLGNSASRHVLRKLGFIETGEVIDQAGRLPGRKMMQLQLDFGP